MRKLENDELNRLTVDEFAEASKTPLIIILDNVRSLHNVGSVFRTSDAYRVAKVYLCGITATPPHAEIHKSALGAEFSVKWEYAEDTLAVVETLKSKGVTVYAIEQAEQSIMLPEITLEKGKTYALILGNEVKGVQQKVVDHCNGCIELPQFGTKHSLNVSVTAGIVIWDFWKLLSSVNA